MLFATKNDTYKIGYPHRKNNLEISSFLTLTIGGALVKLPKNKVLILVKLGDLVEIELIKNAS